MPSTLSDMMTKASALFSPEVLKAIESAEFQMDDIDQLTREDVNEEFRAFRFGIRKKLWLFFKAHKTSNTVSQVDETANAITTEKSSGQRETHYIKEVCSPPELIADYFQNQHHTPEYLVSVSSDDDRESSSSLNQSFAMFPTMPAASSNTFSIPYPGDIRSPFPLNQLLRDSLINLKNIAGNEQLLNCLVVEVYKTLENAVGPDISKDDLRFTAAMLCVEYPGLCSEGKEGWMLLYTSLKNWQSHQEMERACTSKPDEIPNSRENVSMTPESPNKLNVPKKSYLAPKNASPLPYPGGINWPFPLNTSLRDYLVQGHDVLCTNNRRAFQELVRNIASILEKKLGRNPNQYEVRCTVTNLCFEYPVLCQNNMRYCQTLHRAIRKKFNNMDHKKKRSQLQIHPSNDADDAKLIESTEEAELELPSKKLCAEETSEEQEASS